jgi:hypothetical protein
VLRWKPNPTIATLNIHRIHGELDTTFPSRYVRSAKIVPNAGHVLPLTHPELITAFLIDGMAQCG